MKKARWIILIIMFAMMCGCVRSNTNMVINEDKSMTLSLDLMLDENARKSYGSILNNKSEELKRKNFEVKTISEEFYSGIRISKDYKNINDLIYEGQNSVNIYNFYEDNFDNKIFTVKKGLLYNTYYANFEFDSLLDKYNNIYKEKEENEDTEDSTNTGDIKNAEYTFNLSLPTNALFSNNDSTSKDGKTLIWKLNKSEKTNVKFSFKLLNKTILIILIVVGIIVLGIVIFLISKLLKKRNTISSDRKKDTPILKEYDPSIENQLKENNVIENTIGVSAQPLVEIKKEEKEVIPEPKEEVVESKPEVEAEVKPEISNINQEVQKLNNYEIRLPEESMAKKAMEYTKNNPVKKQQLFVNDTVEEVVEEKPKKEEIKLDIPDMDDLM